MERARRAATVLVGTVAAIAVPATAAFAELTPRVTCATVRPTLSGDVLVAAMGYGSTYEGPVTITPGTTRNFFSPPPTLRGQHSEFLPGEHDAAFLVTAPVDERATWILDGNTTVVAAGEAPSCETVTRTTLSVPSGTAAGGVASVVATVDTFVVERDTPGTVELAVDGTVVATAPVTADGVARLELATPEAGSVALTATYVPAAGSGRTGSSATATLDVLDTGTLRLDEVSLAGGTAVVTVTRTSTTGSVSARWMTADGSARAGEDYTASEGVVTFADGETSATVSVPVAPRPAGAPPEQFFVLLQQATTDVAVGSAAVRLPAGEEPGAGDGDGDGVGGGGDGGAGGGGADPGAPSPDTGDTEGDGAGDGAGDGEGDGAAGGDRGDDGGAQGPAADDRRLPFTGARLGDPLAAAAILAMAGASLVAVRRVRLARAGATRATIAPGSAVQTSTGR